MLASKQGAQQCSWILLSDLTVRAKVITVTVRLRVHTCILQHMHHITWTFWMPDLSAPNHHRTACSRCKNINLLHS